ncbi:MAG: hypothetical protein K6T86_13580, partial [Pirellulales bacterium]|nr:hypothetical protein [Pirellulales bacterium]
MTERVVRVAVLGSTGSIGRSALEVILAAPDELRVVGLSAHTRLDLLVHSEANSLRVLASGHCRLTRGVFLEGQHLELRHTPTALLISAPNLRLNGAALRISAT